MAAKFDALFHAPNAESPQDGLTPELSERRITLSGAENQPIG